MGIDLVLSTTGFVTHAGVAEERRAELEAAMMKAMGHSLYQAYLMNSGLDDTSPMSSEAWEQQQDDGQRVRAGPQNGPLEWFLT